MELEKQRTLLSALASDRELLTMTANILKPSYFDPSLKKGAAFLLSYFEKYRDVPKLPILRAETGLVLEDLGKIGKAEIKYVSEEVETFCKIEACTEAVLKSPELIKKGDFGKMVELLKEAVQVGLPSDLGLFYFGDVETRLNETSDDTIKISTGLPELDTALGGGISRQELLTITGISGGGKSYIMLNLARYFMLQGLNGVYISLEMGQAQVSRRLDAMIANLATEDLSANTEKVLQAILKAEEKMGQIVIKRFPENRTNANDIRAWLNQLEQEQGFVPDFIIWDYIDITGATVKLESDNLFLKDKIVTEDIRAIMFDYNAIGITGSQLGKHAETVENLSQSNVQGGSSKVNTTDYLVAIRQSDIQRSQGEVDFDILKARNSRGKGTKIIFEWDPVSGVVRSLNKTAKQLQIKKKSANLGTEGTLFNKSSDSVLDLMTV